MKIKIQKWSDDPAMMKLVTNPFQKRIVDQNRIDNPLQDHSFF